MRAPGRRRSQCKFQVQSILGGSRTKETNGKRHLSFGVGQSQWRQEARETMPGPPLADTTEGRKKKIDVARL